MPHMKLVHRRGDPDPRSILVILPTWVGDFVMATPTLRAIRTRFANAHITFLVEPNLRDLARGGDWMNECVEWPKKERRSPLHREYRDLVWDLRRRRFDWAVLLPNSLRSALTARLVGAKRRIGFDRDGRGLLLTDRLPVRNRRGSAVNKRKVAWNSARAEARGSNRSSHGQTSLPMPPGRFVPIPLVEYFADLAEAIGCERPGDRLELFTTADCEDSVERRLSLLDIADHRPLVVISPGAKYGAAKCWLPDRFAAVADRLIETEDAAVLVTCGPGEEPIAREIGSAMQRKGHVLDAPRLTLGELKSLVRRSGVLICNDAGPRHFARAFDVPVVTIFGPTHPEWTATSYEAERIVRIDVDCGPCQQRVCPLGHLKCMTGVTVDAVYEAARDLLDIRVGHTVR
ncbi:MAG: glycosyltransferase family 9 protein [Phycisphaerae bacterium]